LLHLQLLQWQQPLQLSLSLHSLAHTHVCSLQPSHFALTKYASFIGNSWQLSPAIARGQ
jgi:hypothetical protein